MQLPPQLTAPQLDDALVSQLAALADHLDGGVPEDDCWRELREFNALAGSDLKWRDFQGVYKSSDHDEFVRGVLYHESVPDGVRVSEGELAEIAARAVACETDSEFYRLLFDAVCQHPCGSGLLYYPQDAPEFANVNDPTPEQIAAVAWRWKPRIIAMQVVAQSGGESVGYFIHELQAEGVPVTQVVTQPPERYAVGTVVATALRGVRLSNGEVVDTLYCPVFSNARILREVDAPIGAEVDEQGHRIGVE